MSRMKQNLDAKKREMEVVRALRATIFNNPNLKGTRTSKDQKCPWFLPMKRKHENSLKKSIFIVNSRKSEGLCEEQE